MLRIIICEGWNDVFSNFSTVQKWIKIQYQYLKSTHNFKKIAITFLCKTKSTANNHGERCPKIRTEEGSFETCLYWAGLR